MTAATTAALVATASSPASAAITPVAYQLSGQPATLTNAETGGKNLSAGLYTIDLPNDGSPRTFTIDREQIPSFMVSVLTPETKGNALKVTKQRKTEVSFTSGENSCGQQSETTNIDDPVGFMVVNLGFDAAEDSKRGGYAGADCRAASTMNVVIKRTAEGGGNSRAELRITGEPKATGNTGQMASKADTNLLRAPAGTKHAAVQPGAGFGSAATLVAGTYPVDLKVGATAFYRVRLSWGQRLAVTMKTPSEDTYAPQAGVQVAMMGWTPELVPLKTSSDLSSDVTLTKGSSEQKELGVFTAPVRWKNRDLSYGDVEKVDSAGAQYTTTPGWYYISVQTAPNRYSSDPLPSSIRDIPATMNVAVVGAAQSGPTLVNASGATVAQPPAGEMSVGKGVDQSSGLPWLRIGLSALAVLFAAGAVGWALRSRRFND